MAIREKYDVLWDEAYQALRDGNLRVDHFPVDGDPRWGLSLVLLPPKKLADEIAEIAAELGSTYKSTHHLCDAADLHLTVTSLEPYRDDVDQTTLKHYVNALEQFHDLIDDVRVRLVGLGGSAAGVFVQGFDEDTLTPIRQRMRQTAADLHNGAPPPMSFVRDTAHISVSVHREATPEPAAADYLQRHRHRYFGEMTDATVALVRYRTSEKAMRVDVLHVVR